jgi:hypothetical protein
LFEVLTVAPERNFSLWKHSNLAQVSSGGTAALPSPNAQASMSGREQKL